MIYLPTINNSLSVDFGLKVVQMSMAKTVLELLKMEVRELMMADSMTAINSPRRPAIVD